MYVYIYIYYTYITPPPSYGATRAQAKLLHCYEEWTTSSGTVVKIGGGPYNIYIYI